MKYILHLLLIFILFGCSENQSESRNKAPSDFDVNVNSLVYNNIELTWSESFDPENEKVTYSVYIDGKLIENGLVIRNYNFKNLKPLQSYIGKVIAHDTSGNETSKTFTFNTSGNLPPTSFEIISISSDNISAYVDWTKSSDPEEMEVVYQLYLNGDLVVSDYTLENFRFKGLEADTIYSVKIIASDPEGNESVLNFEIKTADGIYRGDVSFVTQKGVDDFGSKGYVEITGDVEITGYVANSNITDLSSLKTIKRVKGYFTILFCDELGSLDGLGIEYIGKSLRIKNNPKLLNISGLGSLKEVYGDFDVSQNSKLETIEGFNILQIIGGGFNINNNVALISVEGFENLTSTDYIYINANWPLKEIIGFNSLKHIERDLAIINNPEVNFIAGFSMFNSVGRLYLKNTLVDNIEMFSLLTTVSGEFQIVDNKNLKNVKGLVSLEKIVYGDFILNNNPEITSLEGLENLKSIGGTLKIRNNILLSDFCALQNAMQDFSPSFRESINNNAYNPSIEQIANGECK